MSFRCDLCGEAQPEGSSPTKVVTATRNKNYPERFKKTDSGNKVIDRGGQGYETVTEVNACDSCAVVPSDEDRERQERKTRG